jgi:hypothetical protein
MTAKTMNDNGAEYVARWLSSVTAKFGQTEADVLHFARKHGADSIGEMTGPQAKAVIADLAYYSPVSRQAVDATYRRAAAMVPSCGNCGDCPTCC